MDAALATLVDRLAERGMRLGVQDRLRLVLVARAVGPGPELRDALAAVVVKARDERAVFDDVYTRWERERAPRPTPEPPAPEPTVPWRPEDTPAREAGRRLGAWLRRRRGALLVLGAFLTLVPLGLNLVPGPPPVEGDADVDADADPDTDTDTDVAPLPAEATRLAWVPRFGEPIPWTPPRRWDLLALAGLALAGLAGGVLVVRARRELPDPPPPTDERPPAPARPAPQALLLDRGDQEALDWGVAQHTAEEAARELDLDRTVLATAAAAGVPTLRYQRRRQRLGAWLWVDRPGTPQLRRSAEEVKTTLDEAGLPVRVSDIQGLPAELADASGSMRLAEVDGDDRRARVLVLTDGLAWVDAVDHHPPATPHPTLDELRAWDHLTVVDFGEPPRSPPGYARGASRWCGRRRRWRRCPGRSGAPGAARRPWPGGRRRAPSGESRSPPSWRCGSAPSWASTPRRGGCGRCTGAGCRRASPPGSAPPCTAGRAGRWAWTAPPSTPGPSPSPRPSGAGSRRGAGSAPARRTPPEPTPPPAYSSRRSSSGTTPGRPSRTSGAGPAAASRRGCGSRWAAWSPATCPAKARPPSTSPGRRPTSTPT